MLRSSTWIPFALAAGALTLGACSSSDSLELTLEAMADAGEATVTYDIGDGPITETVDTPWELPAEVDGRFSVSLRVENPDDTGTVRCAIRYDGPASPIATGETAADCDLDGSIDGDSLTTSSSARGEERAGPETLDEDTGLTFELVAVDADGAPLTEPQLFEPLVYQAVLGPITEPGELSLRFELTGPELRRTSNQSFRYDLADLDAAGNLVQAIPEPSGFAASRAGTYRLSVAGTLYLASGAELPFADEVEFRLEPTEVTTETVTQVGGILSLEVPIDWEQVASASTFQTNHEPDSLVRRAFSGPSSLELLVQYNDLAGPAIVGVFRFDEPLGLAPDDELAREIAQDPVFEGADPAAAAIGDRPSIRIAANTDRGRIEFDVVTIGDARFAVQVTSTGDDEASWEAALAIRDSIVFDAAAIPPLVHTIGFTVTYDRPDGTTSRIGVDTPADWIIVDGGAGLIGDPDGDVEMRIVSDALGDRTLDDVLTTFAGSDFDPADGLDGFDSAAVARTDTDADGSVDEVVVVGTAGDILLTLELRDATTEPDIALLDAIVATLIVVD
jgi:hypothetical protein